MVNDTIADMLTRVRNANLARHKIVQIPSTKMTRSISSVLLEEGFIQNFEEIGDDVIAEAKKLGIAPVLYEQLEGQYENTAKEIEITKYKVKPAFIGGKAKRKTRKLKNKKRGKTKKRRQRKNL